MNIFSNIYKNDNILFSSTNKKYCIVKNGMDLDEINKMFPDIYQYKVKIITKDKEYNTYIYHKNNNEIITYRNEKIPLLDILSIEKIS